MISIIVPVYNKEPFIKRCVDSILSQSYSDVEVILVDDGSTDSSGQLCDELATEHNNVMVIHQDNMGQLKAREKGFDFSKGKYVMFIDADDWIEENYISDLVLTCEAHPSDIITSAIRYEYGSNSRLSKDALPEGTYDREYILSEILPNYICSMGGKKDILLYSMSNKLISCEVMKKTIGVFKKRISIFEDGLFLFAMLTFSKSITVTHIDGYHYIQYTNSMIHAYKLSDYHMLNDFAEEYRRIAESYVDNNILNRQILILKGRYGIYALANELDANYESRFVKPISVIMNKRVVVYGYGIKGKLFYQELLNDDRVTVVDVVDKNYENYEHVSNPKDLPKKNFDYILIAIEDMCVVREVMIYLISLGVSYEKILFLDKENFFIPRDRK